MRLKSCYLSYAMLIAALIPVLSCCRKNAPQKENEIVAKPTLFSIASPEPDEVIYCGDSVLISLEPVNTQTTADSVVLYEGSRKVKSLPGNTGRMYWNSSDSKMGEITLRLAVHYSDSLEESHNIRVIVFSDIVPQIYTYRVVAQYPHDNQAYTQGLIYDSGMLYESTGLEGKSTVRIVNIKTGLPEKVVPLPQQYFGEGIAMLNDQIYQITWKSQVGFVYDKKTLNQIRSFDYQIMEGWGLSTDGKHLIMTDGSSRIFFIEPEYFTQVNLINAFDNKGIVESLNEIEFINGKIVANLYGQTFVVIIDPDNGKVLGRVDFGELMPQGYQDDFSKVLNGIAWNPANGHLYITGKNWPVLYEVELTPAL